MRIHNSFIINLNCAIRYIKEDGGQVVLQGNKAIPISKNKKKIFFKLLILIMMAFSKASPTKD